MKRYVVFEAFTLYGPEYLVALDQSDAIAKIEHQISQSRREGEKLANEREGIYTCTTTHETREGVTRYVATHTLCWASEWRVMEHIYYIVEWEEWDD
jgi:hypothetical protein